MELRCQGALQTEIAQDLGCSINAVHGTLKQPEVKQAIREFHEEQFDAMRERMRSAAAEALEAQVQLMRGMPVPEIDDAGAETGRMVPMRNPDGSFYVPASVRKAATSDVLDRAGVTRELAVRLTGEGIVPVISVSFVGLTTEQISRVAYPPDAQVIDVVEEDDEGPAELVAWTPGE